MKILCFGSCNIDFVYSVEKILQPGQTIAANGLSLFPGGKGLNQAIALAKAGAKVNFAGCIGPDGQMLRQVLEGAGVELSYLRQVEEKTGHAIIQVDQTAENAIMIFAGANGCVTKEYIDAVLADFERDDVLLIQNEISNLPYLVDQAGNKGMQIYFNPSPLNEQARKVNLNKIYCLLVNETEAQAITDSREPEALQAFIKERYPYLQILLTQGKRGSVFIDQRQMLRQSAYRVESVDTTAAGDAYAGYFLAGICRGDSIKAAMDRASAASAIAVSRNGASASIPTGDEVDLQLPSMLPSLDPVDRRIAMVEDFFRDHYADGTLQQLAQRLGYTTTYTGSWLKSNLGATFTQLLHKKKCQVCAELLSSTDLSVSQIIHQVGCTNESFFRNKFRKEYGCTPMTYRKKRCK